MRTWVCVLAVLLSGGAARSQPEPLAAWVELTDGGLAEARAIVREGECPDAVIDGRARPMKVRVGPEPGFFQTVCSIALPKGAGALSVGGRKLTPPPERIDRIVVMGDTGCRLQGQKIQDCNDPRAWPFALVMKRAVAEKPDLVIHVGDYYYRESPCPAMYSGCAGSPHGDFWPSWRMDFFEPATPLLEAAPWVFARGNHESCDRGWKGWYRMLEAGPAPGACKDESPAFAVPIGGGVTLHVFDSAIASDRSAPSGALALVRRQLDTLPRAGAATDWIVTHRPFWGEAPVFSLGALGVFNVGLNKTEQAAARGKDLSAIGLILSGHIHHFASFDFGADRPAQLVVGTGGDVGESFDRATPHLARVNIDGMSAQSLTFQQYGYFVLERGAGAAWSGAFKDLDGKLVAKCTLVGRKLTCGPAR